MYVNGFFKSLSILRKKTDASLPFSVGVAAMGNAMAHLLLFSVLESQHII